MWRVRVELFSKVLRLVDWYPMVFGWLSARPRRADADNRSASATPVRDSGAEYAISDRWTVGSPGTRHFVATMDLTSWHTPHGVGSVPSSEN